MTKTPFEQRIDVLLAEVEKKKSSLGKAGGVSGATVGNWIKKAKENGYPSEPAEILRQFAARFGRTMDWLLDPSPLASDDGRAKVASDSAMDTKSMALDAARALVELDKIDEATAQRIMWEISSALPTSLRYYVEARRRLARAAAAGDVDADRLPAGFKEAAADQGKKLTQGTDSHRPRNRRKNSHNR